MTTDRPTPEGRTDLVILGAQKAATTTLFDMLARCDRIAASKPKEPHFFSTRDDWRRRLDEYHAIYPAGTDRIRCEASTSYTFFPHRRLEIWKDLEEYNPAIKMIYIVRKPTDRILSHYRHSLRRGYTSHTIEDFVGKYPLPMAICRYHTQIAPYIETLGRDRVLLLEFDDVVTEQKRTLAGIGAFLGLGVDDLITAGATHSNKGDTIIDHRLGPIGRIVRPLVNLKARRRAHRAAAAELPDALARAIVRELEPEIEKLERLMNRDFSAWRVVWPDRG